MMSRKAIGSCTVASSRLAFEALTLFGASFFGFVFLFSELLLGHIAVVDADPLPLRF